MQYTITIRATSIAITPGKEAMTPLATIINNHTVEDEYSETVTTIGVVYDDINDVLYLHRGIDLQYLQKLLGNTKVIIERYTPFKEMKYDFEETIPPRDEDQEDVINFIAGINEHKENHNDSQIFLVKAGGFGKLEPYSRKIPTPTPQGYTLMGDLKVGDYVFDRTGKVTKVLQIFEHGIQDIYRIQFHDGREAYCGRDHLWQVEITKGVKCVLSTGYMLKTYRSILPDSRPNYDKYSYRYKIPVCEPVNYPEQSVPIDPWVLGCFIGNGCCTCKPLTISCPDNEIPMRIAEIYGFTVYKNPGNYSYQFKYPNGRVVQTEEFFKDIPEILLKYSYEKHIPKIYLYNSIENRLSLLRGLMDTDGSISQNENRFHVLYSSTSKQLLYDMQQLLYSLGWSGNICWDTRVYKYHSSCCGSLVFRMPNKDKQLIFSVRKKYEMALKASTYKQNEYYKYLTIKSIKKVGQEKSRCILVDNPEHLYLTEDFIVTHNTYCSGYGAGVCGLRTIIIMHRDSLRSQWMNSLFNMNGYPHNRVYELTSTEELYDIAIGKLKLDYDIYLMTHATFRAGLKRIQDLELMQNIPKALGIGFKIIDEAHLEFKDTLLVDIVFNVKRNLYLTATDGRSSKDENAIFKHVFSKATYYKKKELLKKDNIPSKWVEYISIQINTHVKPNIYRFRVNGGKGMSPATYGKWVIQYDKKQTHFKVCTECLREIYKNEPQAKVLVFMPLIDLCTECAYYISKTLNYDESFPYDLNVKTVNSHNSKMENERNKSADVIVTTIMSLGTGSDIKGITDIICCSPFVSRITAQQVFWRIRYIPKQCHYYDIIDSSVPADIYWWKSRSKTFKRMCTKYKQLSWYEDEEENKND